MTQTQHNDENAGVSSGEPASTTSAPPTKSQQPRRTVKRQRPLPKSGGRSRRVWLGLLAGLLVLGSVAYWVSAPLWGWLPVSRFRACAFSEPGEGISQVKFPADAHFAADLIWIGRQHTAIAPVTMALDEESAPTAMLAFIDLDKESAHLWPAYTAPAITETPAPWVAIVSPETPLGTPLHDQLLRYAPSSQETDSLYALSAVNWRSNGLGSGNTVFLTDPFGTHAGNPDAFPGRCYHAAINPVDGRTLCLTLTFNENPNQYFLAEREVNWQPHGRTSTRITVPGDPIEQVQYSPDGSRIAYLRRKAPDRVELWLLRAGGYEVEGVKLLEGDIGRYPVTFSPDGSRIVYSAPGQRGVMMLYQITVDERPVKPVCMGPGWLSGMPWHTSGQYILAVDEDAFGFPHFWFIEMTPPFERRSAGQIESFEAATPPDPSMKTPGPSVSRDGEWAGGRLSPARPNVLVFLNLDRLTQDPLQKKKTERTTAP